MKRSAIDVLATECAVLAMLRRKAQTKYDVAAALDISHRTALRCLQRLAEAGRVTTDTKGRTTVYRASLAGRKRIKALGAVIDVSA